jgi:hypothetical protein
MSCRRCGSDNKLADAELCPNCVEAAEFREQCTVLKAERDEKREQLRQVTELLTASEYAERALAAERDELKEAFETLDAVCAQHAVVFEKAMNDWNKKLQLAYVSGWAARGVSDGNLVPDDLKEFMQANASFCRWQADQNAKTRT